MRTDHSQNAVHLLGEIVEVIEREGQRMFRIQLKRCHVDVPAGGFPDAHLGDPVAIEARVTIHQTSPGDPLPDKF